MKRFCALLILLSVLLSGCAVNYGSSSEETENETILSKTTEVETAAETIVDTVPEFYFIDDINLLQYLEDSVYADLDSLLDSDCYTVEDVTATYVSQEYIDAVSFNSKENVYFGRTVSELEALFQGERYVFTVNDEGRTDVQKLEEVNGSTYGTVIKNVAIGTGVIMLCVTISKMAAVPMAVTSVFAVAAKTAGVMAVSSATISGVTSTIIRGIETGDLNEALKAGITKASEGFKFGAIIGAVLGGGARTISLVRANSSIPGWRDSETAILSQFDNADEQIAFLNRKEVPRITSDSTRPDVLIRNEDNTFHAIEIKNYDLKNHMSQLIQKLQKQIKDRVDNLPRGSTQEIYLDVRGRHYSDAFLKEAIETIQDSLSSIYPDIPVSVFYG